MSSARSILVSKNIRSESTWLDLIKDRLTSGIEHGSVPRKPYSLQKSKFDPKQNEEIGHPHRTTLPMALNRKRINLNLGGREKG